MASAQLLTALKIRTEMQESCSPDTAAQSGSYLMARFLLSPLPFVTCSDGKKLCILCLKCHPA